MHDTLDAGVLLVCLANPTYSDDALGLQTHCLLSGRTAVGNEETFATNIINNDLNGSGNRNGNHPNNAATIDGNTPGSLHREEEQWALFNSANVGNVKRGERLLQEETPAPTPSPAGDDGEDHHIHIHRAGFILLVLYQESVVPW